MDNRDTGKPFLHPKKLRGTKWTAAKPVNREKHFILVDVVEPESEAKAPEWVDLEAVHSRRVQRLRWQELLDPERWLQGWY